MGNEKTAGMELGAQLRRERLLDIEQRLAPFRRLAYATLLVALLASVPWLGWLWVVPLIAAAATFPVIDRMIVKSPSPGRLVAIGWAVSPLMIAISVALTGAESSPAVYWFALPAITLAARFERRGTVFGALYIGALLLGSTLPFAPDMILDDPTPLIFSGALILATMMFSSAVVESDREHRHSSIVDPLTGLLNRAALAQRAEEIARPTSVATRGGRLGVLIGDLDHFKAINDRHGHACGDAVLRDVAYAIAGSLRSFDAAYRIGGEEFLVLVPEADLEGIRQVGERLREVVAKCSKPDLEVSMSFGGATSPGPELDFSALSAAADEALYEAKAAGRDRVVIARPARVEAAIQAGLPGLGGDLLNTPIGEPVLARPES